MSQRFEGAITTPVDEPRDSSLAPPPERPRRPIMVEAAAAILIVGGVAGAAAAVLTLASGIAPPAGGEPILVIQYALIVLTIAVGLLVRAGRWWLLCVNVVAVLLFLDLTAVPSGNGFAILFSLLDAIVFVTLIRHRRWFDWRPPDAEAVTP
jgi:hypothetical protein